jgi:serpin B
MKRLLCTILAGLLLFTAAACTMDRIPQTEVPTEAPSDPAAVSETEATPEPEDSNVSLIPIENPPIQPGEQIDNPPIELTDPIQPIYETEGTDMTVNGYADFANLLSASILSGTQNQNLSPISVYLALAMVAEGANGDTQAELLKLLGCRDLKELNAVCGGMLETLSVDQERSTLDMHNSLWMAESIGGQSVSFRPEYLNTLAETYRSEANVVEFGTESAAKQIADWINKHTRGKINVSPNALNFDPSTLAVLINTIYLKDGWSETFDPASTEPDTFHAYSGDMTADFMRRFDRNSSVRFGDGWMAYRVWLNRVGYVTFVLPDEGVSLDKLLGTPDAIDKLLHQGYDVKYDVSLRIPKFKFQDKMELTEVLSALGLNLSFTPAADFSGMSDAPCCIDSVIQESYIGVDENGVEAAAYTMVQMRTTAFLPQQLEKLDFHLTRPFFYAIESFDGQVLFIGTVTSPSTGE